MSHPWKVFEVGLVTLELETAFRIGASDGDGLFDSVFVTDANGLPCLPGESLAGVWRHALAQGEDPQRIDVCRQVFGFQEGVDGEASRIRISYGQVHDSSDRPVPFRAAAWADPVLDFVASGVGRDHVRIGMHGAVDGSGKFDELVVPAGARFTFEVTLSEQAGHKLAELVAVLAGAEVRLGGGTRRGLGRFKLVRYHSRRFDLGRPDDLKLLQQLPVALEKLAASRILEKRDLPTARPLSAGWRTARLRLKPIGTWMIGGGLPTGREAERRADDKAWDRVPLSERRILWKDGKQGQQGSVETAPQALYLVPGSSVKGALRHRMAFHARRLDPKQNLWLNPEDPVRPEAHPAELDLFGEIRSAQGGRPGRLHLSDVYVAAPAQAIQHVSLDRFTQGPMDHLLYDELVLGETELELELAVRVEGLGQVARKALQAALDDLCGGRLALGAGRGHGRFLGTLTWRDKLGLEIEEEARQ